MSNLKIGSTKKRLMIIVICLLVALIYWSTKEMNLLEKDRLESLEYSVIEPQNATTEIEKKLKKELERQFYVWSDWKKFTKVEKIRFIQRCIHEAREAIDRYDKSNFEFSRMFPYEGIGINMVVDTQNALNKRSGSGIIIYKIFRDSPATNNLKPGDFIVAVNAEKVRFDLDQVTELIKASLSPVSFTIERGGEEIPVKVNKVLIGEFFRIDLKKVYEEWWWNEKPTLLKELSVIYDTTVDLEEDELSRRLLRVFEIGKMGQKVREEMNRIVFYSE